MQKTNYLSTWSWMLTWEPLVTIILCSVTRLDVHEGGFIATDEISARSPSELRQQVVLQGAFPKKAVYITNSYLQTVPIRFCVFIHNMCLHVSHLMLRFFFFFKIMKFCLVLVSKLVLYSSIFLPFSPHLPFSHCHFDLYNLVSCLFWACLSDHMWILQLGSWLVATPYSHPMPVFLSPQWQQPLLVSTTSVWNNFPTTAPNLKLWHQTALWTSTPASVLCNITCNPIHPELLLP